MRPWESGTWTQWYRGVLLPAWWSSKCSRNTHASSLPYRRDTGTSMPIPPLCDRRNAPGRRLPAACRWHACDWGTANRQLRIVYTHQNTLLYLYVHPSMVRTRTYIRMTVASGVVVLGPNPRKIRPWSAEEQFSQFTVCIWKTKEDKSTVYVNLTFKVITIHFTKAPIFTTVRPNLQNKILFKVCRLNSEDKKLVLMCAICAFKLFTTDFAESF